MKKLKKAISLITALAMVLGFSFTALPSKVHADEKISIPFSVKTNVGEVEITVSNSSEEVSKTVSKDGEVSIEIGKITSGKYTITAEQKELYKPPYDIILAPKINDNPKMDVIYSTVKGDEVDPEGFAAHMSIEAAISLYPESYDKLIDFEHDDYGEKKVMIEAPAKDINDMARLDRKINVNTGNGNQLTDYNLKIDRGAAPDGLKSIAISFALYYKPNTVINKADSDYKVIKAMMPPEYKWLCFSGDKMHKFGAFDIRLGGDSPNNYKIGVITDSDEAYLTVYNIDTAERFAEQGFTNKVLAETLKERDAKTESLADLRKSNKDYEELYAPIGGTILIHWPQTGIDIKPTIAKTCKNDQIEASEESGIFTYEIEVKKEVSTGSEDDLAEAEGGNYGKALQKIAKQNYKIEDEIKAPKGATVEFIKDSFKINGVKVPLSEKEYNDIVNDNKFVFKIYHIIIHGIDDKVPVEEEKKIQNEIEDYHNKHNNYVISYDVKVNKYGEYTNNAKLFPSIEGDKTHTKFETSEVATASAKATLKKAEQKEDPKEDKKEETKEDKKEEDKATYEKTKRQDIKIPDTEYDKAIIVYKAPFFEGYNENGKRLFKPYNNITRAEIATVFARILKIENNKVKTQDKFSDIKGHWAKDNIIRMAEFGSSKNKIISGYPDGSFNPQGNITRAQFAKMIATYWDIKGFKPNIKDANIADIKDHWAKDYITALYNHKFVELSSDKKFEPDKELTRAEVAQILNRITDRALIKLNTPLYEDVTNSNKYYDEVNTASVDVKEVK